MIQLLYWPSAHVITAHVNKQTKAKKNILKLYFKFWWEKINVLRWWENGTGLILEKLKFLLSFQHTVWCFYQEIGKSSFSIWKFFNSELLSIEIKQEKISAQGYCRHRTYYRQGLFITSAKFEYLIAHFILQCITMILWEYLFNGKFVLPF